MFLFTAEGGRDFFTTEFTKVGTKFTKFFVLATTLVIFVVNYPARTVLHMYKCFWLSSAKIFCPDGEHPPLFSRADRSTD